MMKNWWGYIAGLLGGMIIAFIRLFITPKPQDNPRVHQVIEACRKHTRFRDKLTSTKSKRWLFHRWSIKKSIILAHVTVICNSTLDATALAALSAQANQFDTDSREIGIDNRASKCITCDSADVVPGTIVQVSDNVKAFGGELTIPVSTCTIRWRLQDDQGRVTTELLPDSYYVPQGGVRLLSPQHFHKCMSEKYKDKFKGEEPESTTSQSKFVLKWDHNRRKITVPIDPVTNVFTFCLAPGVNEFDRFTKSAHLHDDNSPVPYAHICQTLQEKHLIPPDDDDHSVSTAEDTEFAEPDDLSIASEGDEEHIMKVREPHLTSFDFTDDKDASEVNVITDEEDRLHPQTVDNYSAALLKFHHRFNHLSFSKLKHMARRGILPKGCAKAPTPTCSACLHCKLTRKAWRTKCNNSKPSKKAELPGEVVAVDQMKSSTPGLVAQMAGFLTFKRYHYVTVFVDHKTGYGYTHLQKTQSAEETVEAKIAFEAVAAKHGVTVQSYLADNGVFNSKLWRQHCIDNHQGLSFAGVNAHHQNGVAEKRIRDLTDMARTSLMHAQQRWPTAVHTALWPYAFRMAQESLNEAPRYSRSNHEQLSPVEMFSRSNIKPNPKYWQAFGCPTCVLANELQTTKGLKNKWLKRAEVGLYLGRSPFHARSVALVLNLTTGRVSPQFHVAFDSQFQTVRGTYGATRKDLPTSKWQEVCGFKEELPKLNANRDDYVPPESETNLKAQPFDLPFDEIIPDQDKQREQQAELQSGLLDPSQGSGGDKTSKNKRKNRSKQNSENTETQQVTEGIQHAEPSK